MKDVRPINSFAAMLSKSKAKYIRSLAQQKYRREYKAYIAEGDKLCKEWLNSDENILHIVAVAPWLEQHKALIARHIDAEVTEVTDAELANVSAMHTPNQALLVVEERLQNRSLPTDEWCIALDTLQDPGNMGTIIRIADWFGIKHVVCSPGCADRYNPKVIQSAMGGHLRVNLYETELLSFAVQTDIPVYAAVLGGQDIYEFSPSANGILMIGNESKGLHEDLAAAATYRITIPRRGGAESLNAAVSAGILCSYLLPH